MKKLQFSFAAASDRGLVRGNNEDSAYAGSHLIALADGMGGHAAGEVASQIMIQHIRTLDQDPGDNDMLALLGSVADDANRAIANAVRENPQTAGMGSTLTAVMTNGREVALCHVGDSRGYRLREGKLAQITVDDTFVQSLVDAGELAPEDVSTHPERSKLLKAYVGDPVLPRLETLDVIAGDRLLICSDGLSDPVAPSTIEENLGNGTPAEAASKLIELALRSGGPDNVTVVIADVVTVEDEDKEASTGIEPVMAGALNGDSPDNPRPNTAAARAAVFTQQPVQMSMPLPEGPAETIDGAASSEVIPPAEGQALDGQPSEATKPSLWPRIVISLLVLLILAGGGWLLYYKSVNNYYIAVNDGHIQVENGINFSVFERDLHKPYQDACLTKDGTLRLIGLGETVPGCSPFVVEDLKQAHRDAVTAVDSGSYDTVTKSMQQLASKALPVCVSRTEALDGPGNLNQPGVDCRTVKKE